MRRFRRWGPALLLVTPTLLLIGVFVYGFAAWNAKVSKDSPAGSATASATSPGC